MFMSCANDLRKQIAQMSDVTVSGVGSINPGDLVTRGRCQIGIIGQIE